MTDIINLTKKVIGFFHKPTMISAIEDDITEVETYMKIGLYDQDKLERQKSLLMKKLQDLKDD